MAKKTSYTQEEFKKRAVRTFRRTHKINAVQIKNLRAAGFHIDMASRETVSWCRGKIGIALAYNRPITPKEIVDRSIAQALYWAKQNCQILHTEFATTG